jgi:DNA-3-methyladenine glycosylase I
MTDPTHLVRCFGRPEDPLMMQYHDEEWGVPLHDDQSLFEFLVLESFQSGLSWRTILHKREAFRLAFHGFDASKIVRYTDQDRQRLLNESSIVRNRLKIDATINNAERFLKIQEEFGSFNNYIWRFTKYKPLRNPVGITCGSMPATSDESDAMARDLKYQGFRFIGTTTCYAFMQAAGMVNDHIDRCFRTSVLVSNHSLL